MKYVKTRTLTVGKGYADIRMSFEDIAFICERLPKKDPLHNYLGILHDNAIVTEGRTDDLVLTGKPYHSERTQQKIRDEKRSLNELR